MAQPADSAPPIARDTAAPTRSKARSRPLATLLYWTATLTLVAAAFGLAAWLALMATSLDPTEMIQAGIDPWANAGRAMIESVVLAGAALIGLRLWHTTKFRLVAVAILAAEAVAVVVALLDFYAEYT